MRSRILLLSVLTGSTLWALGCGLGDLVGDKIKEKAAEEISEEIIEAGTGAQDIEIGKDGAQVSIKTDEGTVNINSAGGGSLPADFPLPAYSGAAVTGSAKFDVNGKSSFQVGMTSKDAPKAIGAFYENELKSRGYQVNKVEMNANGQESVMLQGDSAGSAVTVAVVSENGETNIAITLGAK